MMHNANYAEIEAFLNSPGGFVSEVLAVKVIKLTPMTHVQSERLLSQQRAHWLRLHTTRFTPEEFELWIQGIPGCSSCQRDFRRIVASNPPRYDDWNRWTWEVHNTVNKKLGKPEITWEDARVLWGWK